jgi:peptidoglycan/xylan/chitin deacetylase (PgdA/CDA1 family)
MTRKALKAIYFSGRSLFGADRRAIGRLTATDKVAILNLHRISPDPDPYWSPMPPSLFEELARWLSKNLTVSTLSDLGRLETKRPVAVLSFDDGYYDFIEYALPILEKFGLMANLNVIPECAETGKPIWNIRLYDFLRSASLEEIRRIEIPGFTISLKSESAGAKLRFGLAISQFLKNRSLEERNDLWKFIGPAIDGHDTAPTRMMSTDEIRQIAARVELGAHSYSHESMGFETDDFFLGDLEKCETYFNDKLGLPLSIYAFPNGSYRPSQIALLRSRDIKHILLVDEKLASRNSDVLPRRTMYGDSTAELRARALGYI